MLYKTVRKFLIFIILLAFFSGCSQQKTPQATPEKPQTKDKIFLMGIGMLRLNWTEVEGNEIRFRYSDLGLPADFSTRERASFMLDGTFGGGKYDINGNLNYDPENRITEPPLQFLFNLERGKNYLSAGDYRQGFFLNSVFSRYYHPFRGALVGTQRDYFGVEFIGGMARGESGIDEIPADAGAGPYYLIESPILRGSEVVYVIVKSASNPDFELKRTLMERNRDYFIDYDRGEIIFNFPIYPYDELGNPVFILASYQFESFIGRFTRDVFALRSYVTPFDFLTFNFSYLADADGTLSLSEALEQRREIFTLGLNIDSSPLTFFGEFSFTSDPTIETQKGFFGGGVANFTDDLHLYFNSWNINSEFPTFANEQLRYGYSLFQIFPDYSERNIFLSPYQFTRNLGAELFPFTLSRISIDEQETHGFLEWNKNLDRVSVGYGRQKSLAAPLFSNIFYLSSFHNGENTKFWGKVELDDQYDADKENKDTQAKELLLGARQKLWSSSKGDLFFQVDYDGNSFNDILNLSPDTFNHSFSIFSEILTGNEGIFGGYRKEIITNQDENTKTLDADIYEVGIRRHIYRGFFLDSRFRDEESTSEAGKLSNKIISLGGGIETQQFRAMARYEIQLNKTDEQEGRRELWSLFLFGTPVKGMNLNLRYYNRIGKEEAPVSLAERSEEQLNLRFLWRIRQFFSVYSQWRYDTNIELFPPLDRTKSNTLASVQGFKVSFTNKWEMLANYKLLKVWGPIENRKQTIAAELGYLIYKHLRLGVGAEKIDFEDKYNIEGNYHSTVGYFKLVTLF